MAVKTKAAKGAAKGFVKTKKTKAKAKGAGKAAKGGAKGGAKAVSSGASAAAGAAVAARQSPYVQELITNEDLRDNIIDAYQSVRAAVDRASSSKQPISALFDDKKLQKELKNAGENIRDSAVTLREADGSGSGGGLGRKLLLLIVAAGLALAVSEDLRKKVLDALFGAEEEFEYTSTSSPSSSSQSSNGPASTASTETPAAS